MGLFILALLVCWLENIPLVVLVQAIQPLGL